MIGTRLGPYEITAKLGEGGMGEVYRATDINLKRDVAIKVLPAAFVEDKERLARFAREAQLLAQLHHPNIASIFGMEESEGTKALVMELVEGPTLADRLEAGAIPLDESLLLARQIAEALEEAHDKGIIHRDLKPQNIKASREGKVKVLDFGLAKAMEPTGAASGGASASQLAASPTLTLGATVQGMILGTAAYMAPEQAKGFAVDRRADIWAFGVVLYEMLTGVSPFTGDSVPDTLARVLQRDIDFAALPAAVPPAVRRLLRRCLERNPAKRLRDIGDARLELAEGESEASGGVTIDSSRPAPRRPWYRQPLTIALAATALVSSSVAFWALTRHATAGTLTHLSIPLPYGQSLVSGPAISRGGRTVAFVSTDGIARPQLYVRRLDEPAERAIAGTEDADGPFFSPDGRWIAFYAKGGLFKIGLDGGAPVRLADSSSHHGGSWLDDGRIVFNRSWNGGLYVIPENGGDPVPLAQPKPPHEYAYAWPYAVPGSRELLFSRWGDTFDIVRLDLGTLRQKSIVKGWRRAEYVAPGYVVFGSGQVSPELHAVPYRGAKAGAGPVMVLQQVDTGDMSGDSHFDISANGTLAYVSANREHRSLVLVDSLGRATPTRVADGGYSEVKRSPDGRRAAITGGGKILIVDLDRGTAAPLALELKSGAQETPVWSPDGKRLVFASNHEGNWDLYATSASGVGGIEPVVRRPFDQKAESYAPDGTLMFEEDRSDTGRDLWILPPGGDPQPWLVTPAEEGEARFSPDGRLVVYVSNTSGRDEVYVQTEAAGGQRIQVSVDGGVNPTWSPAGDMLYFRRGNLMMAATIETKGGLAAGVPQQLFNGGWELAGSFEFEVMPDGKHFLMIRQQPDAIPTRIDIVLNWFDALRRKMSAG